MNPQHRHASATISRSSQCPEHGKNLKEATSSFGADSIIISQPNQKGYFILEITLTLNQAKY